VSVTGRYVGKYTDYQETLPNSNTLGNFWILDFNARFEAGRALAARSSWLAGSYLTLGAIDLLSKTPPFSYNASSMTIGSTTSAGARLRQRGRAVLEEMQHAKSETRVAAVFSTIVLSVIMHRRRPGQRPDR